MESDKTPQPVHMTVDDAYRQAVEHFNAGRFAEAGRFCAAIVAVLPDHVDAWNMLGGVAHQHKRHQEAAQHFQKALHIDGSRSEIYFNLGVSLDHAGQHREAIAVLRALLEKEPDSVQAREYLDAMLRQPVTGVDATTIQAELEAVFARGYAAQQAGRLLEALHFYDSALKLQPDSYVIMNNIGVVLTILNRNSDAAAILQKAVAVKPDFADAHYNLGNAFMEQGLIDAAIASYVQSIALQPGFLKAHFNIGNAYRELGRLDEAAQSYRNALAIDGDDTGILINLGGVLQEQGELEQALDCFEQAVRIEPDSARAHFNLGYACKVRGWLEKAQESYAKALELQPDYVEALYNLGNIHNGLGRRKEAAAAFRKAIAVKPDYVDAHYNLGNVYKDGGRLEDAEACFQTAISIKPDHAASHINLGFVYQEQCRLDEAIKANEKALGIDPSSAQAHSNLGAIFQIRGELGAARQAFGKALAIDPEFTEARRNLGLCDMAVGSIEAGWAGYEERLITEKKEHEHFSHRRWQGEQLTDKRVLIYAEQGLGDEIIFSLLFNQFARRAKHCLLLCDPRLERLFKRSFPDIQVMGVARLDYPTLEKRLPPVDYQVAAGSLAKYIDPELRGLTPVLVADPGRVAHWRRRFAEFGPKPKVGISWSTGNRTGVRMLSHSKLRSWEPILTVPGVTFVNLFYGDGAGELAEARAAFNADIIDLGGSAIDLRNDLDDLFAMMSALDMIVTTPSTTATMACNIGRKMVYFYSVRLLWRSLGRDSIPWFMDAEPHLFADVDTFVKAARKVGQRVRALAEAQDRSYDY